jgi:uncharacterized membrane protein HdeD (DUF308 family)
MKDEMLSLTWKVMVIRGVVGLAFGVIALVWPGETALAFIVLWGIWALIDGIGSLAEGFSTGPRGPRWLHLLMGAVSLVVAVFAIFSPAVTASTLTWLLGIWLIVRGLTELIAGAIGVGDRGRAFLIGSGIVDLVLGVLFAANPGRAAVGIAWLLGLVALLWGLVFLVLGLVVRKQLAELPDAGTGTPPVSAAG